MWFRNYPGAVHRCWTTILVGVCLVSAWGARSSQGCDTPVYRYAMYRWQPAPYEVYFFHDAAPSDADRQVAERLEAVARDVDRPANLIYLPINLKVDPKLHGIPPDVKDVWDQLEDKTLPKYLVTTPYGDTIYHGSLQDEEVAALLDSPARRTLGQQLEAGKLGVFILLSGSDESANAAALAAAKALQSDVAAGNVALYVSPTQEETESTSADERELAVLPVDRQDPHEAWLVRSLLAAMPQLGESAEPMAFLVYGRARVLPPRIGDGIHRDELLQDLRYISGACSCTIKDQNPGVDLLVRYDWEGAAAAIADRFGSEEGNESRFGGTFIPELVIPSASIPEPVVEQVVATEVVEDEELETPDESTVAASAESQALTDEPAPPETETISSVATATESPDDEGAIANAEPAIVAPDLLIEPQATTSIWIVAGGLAVVLVVLFGLTLCVMRPQ